MRRMLLASLIGICSYMHGYPLLEPVDSICTKPDYDAIRDGMLYIWSKCDVLRAITTNEHDRQAFSQVLVADVMHVASNMLKFIRADEDVSSQQLQHLHDLTQNVAHAYGDAFGASENSSITCTEHILAMLEEVSQVS